uniref:BHLH domain-containing protein n=1 Tax=Anopheles minimus TaxID=112268 RepID=A0A182WMR9_9DIPT
MRPGRVIAQAWELSEIQALRAYALAWARFDANKSTKGASKLRRDLINSEIANLRDLLPLPQSTRQRLSQLQLMALVCVYVRKANYFQQGKCFPSYEIKMWPICNRQPVMIYSEGQLYDSLPITPSVGHYPVPSPVVSNRTGCRLPTGMPYVIFLHLTKHGCADPMPIIFDQNFVPNIPSSRDEEESIYCAYPAAAQTNSRA